MAKVSESQSLAKQSGQADAAARAYRAALSRLVRGEGRHARYVGRPVRITPAAVAREAGRSRNPLYTTHREILEEITQAATARGPGMDMAARIAELEAIIAELRDNGRKHTEEKRALASENLNLLHRARTAEDRFASRSLGATVRKHPGVR